MTRRAQLLVAALVVIAPAALAEAHFILVEPASWLVENRLGDPQKLGPCGGTSADSGMPTNALGKVRGGDKVHVKVQETVFHPGFYRVALAVNSRAELPPDPEVVTRTTDRGPWSVSAAIQYPPQVPVLADGLFQHTARVSEPFEADVQLPNISCEKCTLQIIQYMADHGGSGQAGRYPLAGTPLTVLQRVA